MPNQSDESRVEAWVRVLSLSTEPQGLESQRDTWGAVGLHGNEIRLIQKLVLARQHDIEGGRITVTEQPLTVSEASWQSFLGRWQAAEKTLQSESVAVSDLAPHPVLNQVGMTRRRWAANQHWLALAAGIGVLAMGVPLTYSLLQPETADEDDMVMRGDEQVQRVVVASIAVARAKADDVEKLLRDAGVLVRRIEIPGGVRIEAKITNEMLKINSHLMTQLEYLNIHVLEHGRVIVIWVER